MLKVLQPFDEATLIVEREAATVLDVIVALSIVQPALASLNADTRELATRSFEKNLLSPPLLMLAFATPVYNCRADFALTVRDLVKSWCEQPVIKNFLAAQAVPLLPAVAQGSIDAYYNAPKKPATEYMSTSGLDAAWFGGGGLGGLPRGDLAAEAPVMGSIVRTLRRNVTASEASCESKLRVALLQTKHLGRENLRPASLAACTRLALAARALDPPLHERRARADDVDVAAADAARAAADAALNFQKAVIMIMERGARKAINGSRRIAELPLAHRKCQGCDRPLSNRDGGHAGLNMNDPSTFVKCCRCGNATSLECENGFIGGANRDKFVCRVCRPRPSRPWWMVVA